MKMQTGYHYAESGLDNIWLVNGYSWRETASGRSLVIEDVDGLHLAIGLALASSTAPLTGREVRFLRHELDLSQKFLASLLGVSESTVARWERGDGPSIPTPEQRLLSVYYQSKVSGDQPKIAEALERIASLDAELHRDLHLARLAREEWQVCAA